MDSKQDSYVQQSDGQAQAIWQAVDYSSLSIPTRPNSPPDQQSPENPSSRDDFSISPDAIFDFGDLGMLDPAAYNLDDPCVLSLAQFNLPLVEFEG